MVMAKQNKGDRTLGRLQCKQIPYSLPVKVLLFIKGDWTGNKRLYYSRFHSKVGDFGWIK